ncbi:MAG: putative peptidoglycan glycosyltransferase FtsW [Alphaproteobacteria bacterium]
MSDMTLKLDGFDRTDRSLVSQWWWTVDRQMLFAILALAGIGVLMVALASPAVAERIGAPYWHFTTKHLIFLAPALIGMVALSAMDKVLVRRLSFLGYVGVIGLLVLVPLIGFETKGAQRWIHLGGFSLQPSEFAKPALAVVTAWVLAQSINRSRVWTGRVIAALVLAVTAGLTILQPDFGMTAVLAAIWGVQVFVAGLPWLLVIGVAGLAIGGAFLAYVTLPHVASRVDRFLMPAEAEGNYQVAQSLKAFEKGGLTGVGPGHGTVKDHLPDSHADFIFSVAGEELGLWFCLLIIALIGFIAWRAMGRALKQDSQFILLVVTGIVTQFVLQSFIHMGSALKVIPAKGMTLPFVSYGGSSLLAMGVAMGLLLCFTRQDLVEDRHG